MTSTGSTGAAPGSAQMSASSTGGGQGQFMTQMQANQMMASKLIGTTVVGANNESIGDINDVIVDRNGQAQAVVIGVGGFLGIGEKDVAVPFNQLDFAASRQMNQQTSSTGGGSTATSNPATTTTANDATNSTVNTTGSTGSAQQNSATNRQTATTGNTGNPGSSAAATSVASNDADGGVPDRIMLRMTKAELQAAPTFTGASRNRSNDNAGAGSSGATTPGGNTGTSTTRP